MFRATAKKRPPIGLILHSDRGSQHCAHDYKNLLKQLSMTVSMSRKGDCWDNAPIESFWGILKDELVHHRKFKTRQQTIQEITEYIEIFYNRQRKKKRLGYLSPAAFTSNIMKILQLLKPMDSLFDSTDQWLQIKNKTERALIKYWKNQYISLREIGRRLNRSHTTISRELRCNLWCGRHYYIRGAQELYEYRLKRRARRYRLKTQLNDLRQSRRIIM